MLELIQLGTNTYYIPGSTNVGVFEQGGSVWLIDTGLNAAFAAEVLETITAKGWRVEAIINTHYHADHVGGNRYLQEATGCACYCPLPVFATDPLLNPSFVFGAYPPAPLHADIFLAEASDAQDLTEDVLPEGLAMHPLPGHCGIQMAISTSDRVLFCADAVIGAKELSRYKLSYLYDLKVYLASLDKLEAMRADWYVPSHEVALNEIAPLVALNRQACMDLIDWIMEFCAGEGMGHDELLKAVFDRMGRHLHLAQYALSGCTLRAYLGYLIDEGRLVARAKGNILRFRIK